MRELEGIEIRELAMCYLDAMDTLENNPRYPDGIQARYDGESVEFDTFKLVYGPSAGWVEVDRVQDLSSFGDGWSQENGTYATEQNIDAMADNLRDWDKIFDIENILGKEEEE